MYCLQVSNILVLTDGDMDVIMTHSEYDSISYYENDGVQSFTERVITSAADGAISVFAVDVDGDGDIDVLSCIKFTFVQRIFFTHKNSPSLPHIYYR